MMNNINKPKTFEEIDERLQTDLRKISDEIEEIENHLQIAQEMLEAQMLQGASEEVLQKYKKGIEELQKGLEMFLGIKDEIQQTITKLYETKKQADEYMKTK